MEKEIIKLINDTVSSVALAITEDKSIEQMAEHLKGIGVPNEVIDHCITIASIGQDIVESKTSVNYGSDNC